MARRVRVIKEPTPPKLPERSIAAVAKDLDLMDKLRGLASEYVMAARPNKILTQEGMFSYVADMNEHVFQHIRPPMEGANPFILPAWEESAAAALQMLHARKAVAKVATNMHQRMRFDLPENYLLSVDGNVFEARLLRANPAWLAIRDKIDPDAPSQHHIDRLVRFLPRYDEGLPQQLREALLEFHRARSERVAQATHVMCFFEPMLNSEFAERVSFYGLISAFPWMREVFEVLAPRQALANHMVSWRGHDDFERHLSTPDPESKANMLRIVGKGGVYPTVAKMLVSRIDSVPYTNHSWFVPWPKEVNPAGWYQRHLFGCTEDGSPSLTYRSMFLQK